MLACALVALVAAGAAATVTEGGCSSDVFSASDDAGLADGSVADTSAGDAELDTATGDVVQKEAGAADPCPDASVPGAVAVVASAQPHPAAIAADSSGVYWLNQVADGGVLAVAVGCDPGAPRVVAANQSGGGAIATSPSSVVWTVTGQRVAFVTKPASTPVVQGVGRPFSAGVMAISPTGADFYAAESAGGVVTCALTNCSTSTHMLTLTTAPLATGLAVDDALAVYTGPLDAGGFGVSTSAAGGTALATTTVASEDAGVAGRVALTATSLFWTNAAEGTVSMAGRDGQGARLLASGERSPGALVVDDTHVYWATADAVHRARLDGTTPVTSPEKVTGGLSGSSALAAFDRFLYVTDPGTGRVLRVAK